jgi:hypothetical protein
MNQLTPEQIKTLEDAFASYPKDFQTTSKYASMQGIPERPWNKDELVPVYENGQLFG